MWSVATPRPFRACGVCCVAVPSNLTVMRRPRLLPDCCRPHVRCLALGALLAAAACGDDGPAAPPATGVLRVTTTTTGLDVDPDVYVFTRDGVESLEIGLADSVELPSLAAGSHTVQLSGVAAHCTVVGESTRSATVVPDDTVDIAFEVSCPATLSADVAFMSPRDGNAEIYALSLRSLRFVRLTDNPGDDVEPDWSPDGTQLAFASSHEGAHGIYVMNADGSGARPVFVSQFVASGPDWSPDGERLLFLYENNFYVVSADGTGLTQLTFNDDVRPLGFEDPQWSPDGQRIAFGMGGTSSGGIHKSVVVANADGSGQLRLSDQGYDSRSPRWSPDGARLAYERDGDVYVVNADGTGTANVTNTPDLVEDGVSWTADSSALLFFAHALDRSELHRASADGSGRVRLATLPERFYEAAWNPHP